MLNVAILKLSYFLIKHCDNYIVQTGAADNGFRFKRILEFGKSFTEGGFSKSASDWFANENRTFFENLLKAKSPIDPSTEQNGYLLISHMIAKYNLPRSLILTCFEKLLKSYTLEVKLIVNEGPVHI